MGHLLIGFIGARLLHAVHKSAQTTHIRPQQIALPSNLLPRSTGLLAQAFTLGASPFRFHTQPFMMRAASGFVRLHCVGFLLLNFVFDAFGV